MVFLILYVNDILLIENDVGTLTSVKIWLPIYNPNKMDVKTTFLNRSLDETSYMVHQEEFIAKG